MNYLIYAVKYK